MKFLLKAMIIIAWHKSGSISTLFEGDGLQKVLSIFITAAVLKFAQGTKTKYANLLVLICSSSSEFSW